MSGTIHMIEDAEAIKGFTMTGATVFLNFLYEERWRTSLFFHVKATIQSRFAEADYFYKTITFLAPAGQNLANIWIQYSKNWVKLIQHVFLLKYEGYCFIENCTNLMRQINLFPQIEAEKLPKVCKEYKVKSVPFFVCIQVSWFGQMMMVTFAKITKRARFLNFCRQLFFWEM